MLTILRGDGNAIQSRLPPVPPLSAQQSATLVLRSANDPLAPVPFGALRSFLAQARLALGDARVDQALAPERALLALSLRGLTPALDPAERATHETRGGLALSVLPNVVLNVSPLVRAWRNALVSLFAGERVLLVVPELDAIDLESLASLRPILAGASSDSSIDVLIGHDPSVKGTTPLGTLVRGERLGYLAFLEALPITHVELLDAGGAAPSAPRARAPFDPLDDGLETRAFDALRTKAPDAATLGRAAMRASFDAFGFEATVRFADALESAGLHDDEVRTLGALALHNLTPLSKEPWIGERLVSTFEHLVGTHTDRYARAHWGYRLALAHGRTRGALDQALLAADAAVEDADAVRTTPRGTFAGAWTRNARAYVKTRLEDFAGAAEDTEAGLGLIENDLDAGPSGVPGAEVRVARILLSNNRSRVAQAAGDGEGLSHWRARTNALVESAPAAERPGSRWFQPPEDDRDLEASLAQYQALLARARVELDPETEAIAAHGLGVTLYKLREGGDAHQAFATSLRIWRITRGYAEDLLTEELNCAVTAFRSGAVTAAEEGFARVRANPLMQNDAAQAETLAALAMVAAKGGDRAKAHARGDEAVRAAEGLEEPDVLVRVLRSTGEAYLALGEREAAQALLARALETIAAVEAAGGAIATEDELGAIVTALEAKEAPDPALARRAVTLAPYALADANAWWDVPRLLSRVGDLRRDPALAEPFALIDRAVGQRARP